jgi:Ankyrin repeats (many copies)
VSVARPLSLPYFVVLCERCVMSTVLHAAASGSVRLTRELIKNHVHLIDALDDRGMTPLGIARQRRNSRAVNLLMNFGARVYNRDHFVKPSRVEELTVFMT